MIAHIAVYLVAYIVPGFLGLLSFFIYTHVLTVFEYGIYSIGASVAFLVASICYGWIRFSTGRFQAESHETNFIPFAVLSFIAATLIVVPAILLANYLVVHADLFLVCAILAMAAAQALFEITQEIRRARHQSLSFTRATIARSVLSLVFSVSISLVFARGDALLIATAGGFLIVAIAFLIGHRDQAGLWPASRDALEAGLIARFLRYGIPLTLSGLVFSGNSTLVRLLTGGSLGAEAVGQFGAALDLTGQLCGMVAGSVSSIVGPRAIGAYRQGGLEGARREMRAGGVLFLGIVMPTVVGLAIVATPFSNVIAGATFEGAIASLIPVLSVSRGLNVLAQFYLHLGFQIVEKPLRQVSCGIITLLANVLLNLVLTQKFGLLGAAWALLISDFIGVVVSFALLRNVFPFSIPLRQIGAIGVCVTAMAVGCHFIGLIVEGTSEIVVLSVTVMAGVLIYGLLAYVLDVGEIRSQFDVRRVIPGMR